MAPIKDRESKFETLSHIQYFKKFTDNNELKGTFKKKI